MDKKPFNLERALAGDKVITRDGREVVQLFYADKASEDNEKVIAVVDGIIEKYQTNGAYYSHETEYRHDLFMAPTTVKVERWVNVYADGHSFTHTTKEQAEKSSDRDMIACVHLTGEYTL